MPVYLIEVRGDPRKRLVKADTDAQARKHIVSAKALTAEQLSDYLDADLTIEKAEATTTTTGTDDNAGTGGESGTGGPPMQNAETGETLGDDDDKGGE